MNNVGQPAKRFDRLEHTTDEKHAPLHIAVHILGICLEAALTFKELVVIHKVHLQAWPVQHGGNLYDEGMVRIVHNYIDTGKTYYIVQLIAPLIDRSVTRRKDPYIVTRLRNRCRNAAR